MGHRLWKPAKEPQHIGKRDVDCSTTLTDDPHICAVMRKIHRRFKTCGTHRATGISAMFVVHELDFWLRLVSKAFGPRP